MSRTVAVRFASGVTSESRREAHLATWPGTGVPATWLTFCGMEIPAHQAEVFDRPAGMPCMRCLTDATPSITGGP
ncbi:hypothetical protein [Saccharopolyspora hordei]|uniref:Zinc-finger n=1 Tax=Saccharopolyspora hordei TaxID=1838 RepID=A0A853ALW5_9PSEU|nr:hypothetical protein [Saccharopolyspora hordei]NYI85065.1 hypothetical protein [Saccharopolyspora hordei]